MDFLFILLIALGIIVVLFIARFILTDDQKEDFFHAGSWGMSMPAYPRGFFRAKAETLRAAYLSGVRSCGYGMGREGYENAATVHSFYKLNDTPAIQEYNTGYTEGQAAYIETLIELAFEPA